MQRAISASAALKSPCGSDHRVDDPLGRRDRQRCVGGQLQRELAHVFVELGVGQHAVDQPHRQRFVGAVAAPGEHDLARGRMPDRGHQAVGAVHAVAEAQARGRNRELAGARPHSADRRRAPSPGRRRCRSRGSTQSPAWANPRWRVARHRPRLRIPARCLRSRGASRIRRCPRRPRTPRCLRRAARCSGSRDRHRMRHRLRDRAPHVAADRVAARRVVEHHAADRPVALHAQSRFAHRLSSNHIGSAQLCDLRVGVAELAQDLVVVLARRLRWRASSAPACGKAGSRARPDSARRRRACGTGTAMPQVLAPGDRRTPRPSCRSARRARRPC